jgi:hypothetical protein
VKTVKPLILLCLVLMSVYSFASSPPACSPVGTWYGGGDYKYVLTITPVARERFAMHGEVAADQSALGYAAWTTFSSQVIRTKNGRFVAQGIALFTTSHDIVPPPESIELDAIRGWMEFADCDNIRVSYDFFAAYFDPTKVPFIDPPDLSYLPPGGISETYHRMPTSCAVCDVNTAPATVARKKH